MNDNNNSNNNNNNNDNNNNNNNNNNEDFKDQGSKLIKDIFWKLMFNILKKLHKLHNDLPFLPERMKIEKVEKLVANLHD